MGRRLVSGMFEPSGVELSRHIEFDRSCSEQSRRKAVTQSYGTTAVPNCYVRRAASEMTRWRFFYFSEIRRRLT